MEADQENPAGLYIQASRFAMTPSKAGFGTKEWLAIVVIVATISYFWTRILRDIFEGVD